MAEHFQVLIIGGGAAGITVAARLSNLADPPRIGIVEPSDKHYYQPLWTLVGGGVVDKQASMRDEADYIPDGATWIKDHAAIFQPGTNTVITRTGTKLTYDILVVAPGLQLDWHRIRGLSDSLGTGGVCSNYSYDTVDATWRFLKDLDRGTALFTYPTGPVKCGGAPQKIMWLAEDHLRRKGARDQVEVVFASALGSIFGVPRYARTLERLAAERDIVAHYRYNLVEVRARSREAIFERVDGEHLDGKDELIIKYDLLHVTPPMSAPDVIKHSPLANDEGWVEVDAYTTQHTRYPNVFALGDASSLPCAKTGAAVRKQAPVTVANIQSFMAGDPLTARYDGYSSCPLVTGYGRLVLAEFGYGGVPMESFPFDQSRERYSMWALKVYGLPKMYWNGMLRGRM